MLATLDTVTFQVKLQAMIKLIGVVIKLTNLVLLQDTIISQTLDQVF